MSQSNNGNNNNNTHDSLSDDSKRKVLGAKTTSVEVSVGTKRRFEHGVDIRAKMRALVLNTKREEDDNGAVSDDDEWSYDVAEFREEWYAPVPADFRKRFHTYLTSAVHQFNRSPRYVTQQFAIRLLAWSINYSKQDAAGAPLPNGESSYSDQELRSEMWQMAVNPKLFYAVIEGLCSDLVKLYPIAFFEMAFTISDATTKADAAPAKTPANASTPTGAEADAAAAKPDTRSTSATTSQPTM